MTELTEWKDEVVQYPDRYKRTQVDTDLFDFKRSPGEVIQNGTPQNAKNFNALKNGIEESMSVAKMAYTNAGAGLDAADSALGERQTITLKNTDDYPFNNSKITVSLKKSKSTSNYMVFAELIGKTGGGSVGDITISDKMLNGFKIEFSGAAKTVTLNIAVTGGNW